MKLKHVSQSLSPLHASLSFPSPNIQLEQYPTSIDLASHFAWTAWNRGDLSGSPPSFSTSESDSEGEGDCVIVDLGCGTGILGISTVVVGATEVYAVDCDEEAMDVARRNVER